MNENLEKHYENGKAVVSVFVLVWSLVVAGYLLIHQPAKTVEASLSAILDSTIISLYLSLALGAFAIVALPMLDGLAFALKLPVVGLGIGLSAIQNWNEKYVDRRQPERPDDATVTVQEEIDLQKIRYETDSGRVSEDFVWEYSETRSQHRFWPDKIIDRTEGGKSLQDVFLVDADELDIGVYIAEPTWGIDKSKVNWFREEDDVVTHRVEFVVDISWEYSLFFNKWKSTVANWEAEVIDRNVN